ncbi:MAG TPA: FAD binding domain-containing protein [Burkholderiales bacterium]|jgi:carbon-monoxide dehydrogenase medium subunit
MKAPAFDYARPKDVAEAIKLLAQGGRPAAGTQSLGPMLNLRVAHPTLLVDLRGIDELKSTSETSDSVVVGACVTHSQIEDKKIPDATGGMMAAVAASIAYRAVRNRGTIGGSLAHADPAADWPSALTLLNAVALIAGPRGRREVRVESLATGIFTTVLASDELIVALRIPKRSPRTRYGYWKFCRKAGEFANAIGAVLHDPETNESRAVLGALAGPPRLVDAKTFDVADIDEDPYSRRLHAVALKRAFAQIQ